MPFRKRLQQNTYIFEGSNDISRMFFKAKTTICSALIICDTSLAYFYSLSCPAVRQKTFGIYKSFFGWNEKIEMEVRFE